MKYSELVKHCVKTGNCMNCDYHEECNICENQGRFFHVPCDLPEAPFWEAIKDLEVQE